MIRVVAKEIRRKRDLNLSWRSISVDLDFSVKSSFNKLEINVADLVIRRFMDRAICRATDRIILDLTRYYAAKWDYLSWIPRSHKWLGCVANAAVGWFVVVYHP